MQPVRQTGPTLAVAAGATVAVTKPSSVVLVANTTAALAYFSAQSTNAAPVAAAGVPIPANNVLAVAIPESTAYYGAFAGALTVTPVEMLKTQ